MLSTSDCSLSSLTVLSIAAKRASRASCVEAIKSEPIKAKSAALSIVWSVSADDIP